MGRLLESGCVGKSTYLFDAYPFPTQQLAVLAGLDRVAAGLHADFLGPRSRDDEFRPVDLDADSGVLDFNDQRALRREQANDRAAEIGDAGRFAQS